VARAIRVRYERGVLVPLEEPGLREGEEAIVRIEKPIRELLKDLVGVLGESSEEELERYEAEVWRAWSSLTPISFTTYCTGRLGARRHSVF